MDNLRILIVDDESLARARIRELLADDVDVGSIVECVDGEEAISLIKEEAPDLVFLDVQMPEKDGFDVIEEVGIEQMPVFILVTAYDQYSLRAFDAHALDYLLKPFDDKRFAQTLERAKRQIRGGRSNEFNQNLLSLIKDQRAQPNYLERLLIRTDGRFFFLKTEEVDWFESAGNYVRLHVGKSNYLLRESVSNLERQLDPEKFLRIHRRAIVSFNSIKEIQQMFHGQLRVILRDGTNLTIGRSFRGRLPRIADSP